MSDDIKCAAITCYRTSTPRDVCDVGWRTSRILHDPSARHARNSPSGAHPLSPSLVAQSWRTQHSHAKSWPLCASARSFVSAPPLGAQSPRIQAAIEQAVEPVVFDLPSLARRWRPPTTSRYCMDMATLRLDSFTLSDSSFDAFMVRSCF